MAARWGTFAGETRSAHLDAVVTANAPEKSARTACVEAILDLDLEMVLDRDLELGMGMGMIRKMDQDQGQNQALTFAQR